MDGVSNKTKSPMDLTEGLVERVDYLRVPETTTTVCMVVMPGGFVVVGKSACVDPLRFDAQLGEKYAREDAMRQACEHVAFWLVLSAAERAGA